MRDLSTYNLPLSAQDRCILGLDPDDAQKGRWESEGERSKERGLSALEHFLETLYIFPNL